MSDFLIEEGMVSTCIGTVKLCSEYEKQFAVRLEKEGEKAEMLCTLCCMFSVWISTYTEKNDE